jgi:hypothetical protein
MRIAVIFVILTAIGLESTAYAHGNSKNIHSHHEVHVSWIWIEAHWNQNKWIIGHWIHPRYGKSYRRFHLGPPHAHQSHHHNTIHVHGHWSGKGKNKKQAPIRRHKR